MPYKHPQSQYWYARYTDPDGKRRTVSTGTTNRREAVRIEHELRIKATADKKAESFGHRTFDQLMEVWLDHVNNRERDIHAMKALFPHFSGYRMDSIDSAMVNRYRQERRSQGRSDSTIRRELLIFQSAINQANRCGWGLKNPISGNLPKKSDGRIRWLKYEEYEALIDACSTKAPHLPDIITLAVHTGMRIGEILGLTWDRVELAQSRIHLNPENQKNQKYGSIPLNTTARRLLARLFSEDATYVFEIDGEPIKSVKRSFATACRRAGIEDFHLHDLRHTCASWLVQNGADLAKVSEVMRHSDIRQTMVYAHLRPKDAIDTVSILDSIAPESKPKLIHNSGKTG